ncbi:hypothetical protein APHAL10511_004489 [Amanita phalloides]|nr:hypothetical protein APHAL10511_004489 [Amanita phalloides]
MLRHQLHFFRPRLCRHSSAIYPFHNLRAFPFRLSPEDAVVQMAPYASILLVFKQVIGSFGARLLPGFGFEPIRPTRIVPVYFPAWVIDGELQASVTYNNTQRTILSQFLNTYLPGNDFKILSLLSFWYKELQQYQLVPFTPELERQHDVDVQCLPYTVSPFSVLDIAKDWPHGDVEITDNFRFSPTSLKLNMAAAYPILIPLYLVQYHARIRGLDTELSMTMFMEGFSKKGRIFVEKYSEPVNQRLRELMPNAPASFIRFTHALDDFTVQPLRGDFEHFTRFEKLGVPQAPIMSDSLRRWLDDKLYASDYLAPLLANVSQGSPTLRGEDERIRDFMDTASRSDIHTWLSIGTAVASTEMLIETIKSTTLLHASAGGGDAMGGTVQSLEKNVKDLLQKRQELTPTWWKEWERRDSTDEISEQASGTVSQAQDKP